MSALYFIRTQHFLCVFRSHLLLTTTQFIKSTDCYACIDDDVDDDANANADTHAHALLMLHVIDAALVGKQIAQ